MRWTDSAAQQCGFEFARRAERAGIDATCRCAWPGRQAPCPGRIRRCGWRRARPAPARSSVHRTGRYSWRTSASRIACTPSCTCGIDVLHDRDRGCMPSHAGHRLGQAVGGLAHQRRMRGHADRELDRLAHAAFGEHARARDRPRRRGRRSRSGPASCSWRAPRPRSRKLPCRRPAPAHRRRRAPRPSRRCPRARRPASTGRASRTSCAASCSDSAPAATSALYSPRLWPASMRRLRATALLPQRATPRRRRRAAPAGCIRCG